MSCDWLDINVPVSQTCLQCQTTTVTYTPIFTPILLNDYLLELTMNENKVTKKDFEEFLCSIRNVPEIPNRQVIDILEGYKNSDLYVDLIDYILNSD